jgi:putative membrane protein
MKNLRKLMLATAFIGLLASMQSCKSKDDANYQMDNQTFVNQASSSNNFEIAAGTLATTKSSNTLILQYGSKMASEHTGVGRDLTAIASSKNLNVSTTLQADHQTKINALASLSGAQFDEQFISMMISSHQEAISLFQNASSSRGVMDGDLRNFAANKLPSLKAHLQEAQNLQTKVQAAP